MKKRAIQLRHPPASTRIRSGIAFLSVCVLVGLVAFFAGALIPLPGITSQVTNRKKIEWRMCHWRLV